MNLDPKVPVCMKSSFLYHPDTAIRLPILHDAHATQSHVLLQDYPLPAVLYIYGSS